MVIHVIYNSHINTMYSYKSAQYNSLFTLQVFSIGMINIKILTEGSLYKGKEVVNILFVPMLPNLLMNKNKKNRRSKEKILDIIAKKI